MMDPVQTPRSYRDECGIARGLDLVGERWALLVVRELLLGPRRFTDLRAGLPGASPNVLTQRLRELERAGVVRRRRLAPPAGSWAYELTEWGAGLEPLLLDLGRWALAAPAGRMPDGFLSAVSAVLALRTGFPLEDARWSATYELRFGEERYTVRVREGRLEVEPGSAAAPDAVIETDPRTFTAVLNGNRSFAGATATGELAVTGDPAAARRLLAPRDPGP
jgi:DNA-binding HxlR family transcriptional regulator